MLFEESLKQAYITVVFYNDVGEEKIIQSCIFNAIIILSFQFDTEGLRRGIESVCVVGVTAGLPTNKLSTFLEDRVNVFLRNSDSGAEVFIRTVSSFDKVLDTRTLMKDRFQVRCRWLHWVCGWQGQALGSCCWPHCWS